VKGLRNQLSGQSEGRKMAGQDDTVLVYWKDQREQFRQSEVQRSVMTNYILLISAGISGFVVQQHFSVRTIPLSILTVIIGLYGALTTAKYHERANYHLTQARALTQVLVDAGALPDNDAILAQYRSDHYTKYPRLAPLRLNWLWTGLHIGVTFYGAILLIITFVTQ
jgi:hypothetical protein